MINTNITNVRKELFSYANSCLKYNEIINISTKDGNVIMMSLEEYNNLIESLNLASIPGIYEKIQKGVETPVEECEKLKWK